MKIVIDENVIGSVVCTLQRSIISDEIVCKKHQVTAYMVRKDYECGVYARVCLDNGTWWNAEDVFRPENEAAERKKFLERHGK